MMVLTCLLELLEDVQSDCEFFGEHTNRTLTFCKIGVVQHKNPADEYDQPAGGGTNSGTLA
jgi:hypothetical protein